MSTRVIGITGGVGMGKSTAAKLLREQGVPVVDSDDLARAVVALGEPALAEIAGQFGSDFLNAQGEMDRAKMAAHIFSNTTEREKLESIIHPRVRERWRSEIKKWRAAGQGGVVVIPLLFEVGAAENFDITLCVACSQATQLERLHERGWSNDHIGQRIAAQLSIEVKMERADHVLWNEGNLETLRAQLARLGCVQKISS